jgi:methyl coenzyme M reductase alpha subunit
MKKAKKMVEKPAVPGYNTNIEVPSGQGPDFMG